MIYDLQEKQVEKSSPPVETQQKKGSLDKYTCHPLRAGATI